MLRKILLFVIPAIAAGSRINVLRSPSGDDDSSPLCEEPTGLSFAAEANKPGSGYKMLFDFGAERKIQVMTSPETEDLSIAILGLEKGPLTTKERSFVARASDSLEDVTGTDINLDVVDQLDTQSARVVRLMSEWPDGVDIEYNSTAQAPAYIAICEFVDSDEEYKGNLIRTDPPCFGRCGDQCVGIMTQYTEDCVEYDSCISETPSGCGDTFLRTIDDRLWAPNCVPIGPSSQCLDEVIDNLFEIACVTGCEDLDCSAGFLPKLESAVQAFYADCTFVGEDDLFFNFTNITVTCGCDCEDELTNSSSLLSRALQGSHTSFLVSGECRGPGCSLQACRDRRKKCKNRCGNGSCRAKCDRQFDECKINLRRLQAEPVLSNGTCGVQSLVRSLRTEGLVNCAGGCDLIV